MLPTALLTRPIRIARTTASMPLWLAGRVASLPARWSHRLPKYVTNSCLNLHFKQVSEPGFDELGRERVTDSAWSMVYFKPDDRAEGHIYVGTNNNIVGLSKVAIGKETIEAASMPPEIRRYRPDQGELTWESVLDYADHEAAPYSTIGFRTLCVYRSPLDGKTYLYAGTAANRHPSVWRTATGDPDDWEMVFAFPFDEGSQIGSVRGMVAHEDGLLYISTTPTGDISPTCGGQIWVSDGTDFTPVVLDGFGNPYNRGITTVESFNGALYAGTYNPRTGFEVWKLRDINHYDAPPKRIIAGGAGHTFNEAVMSLRTFKDHLYIGTGIPLGFNPSTRRGPYGCSLLRLDAQDHMEVVVGRKRDKPISNFGAGFGWYMNSYCWYMKEHQGHLYIGTWDLSRTLVYLQQNRHLMHPALASIAPYLDLKYERWGSAPGGDLYRSTDGVRWEPVFVDGLGNPDNHGIRTLESTPEGMYIGTENPFSRMEIWRLES